ncbi:MAG: primosomal protein N' [Gammaproteobacteria bacterium]|nr:primosomal protein N' [Gammaproteobacteria bacterium]
MPSPSPSYLRLAIPTPLRRLFDYLPPEGMLDQELSPGLRVKVPFGRSTVIGILHSVVQQTDVPASKLRRATEIIDAQPLLPPSILKLLLWAGEYYHHPMGEVMQNALPVLLREGRPAEVRGLSHWLLSEAGSVIDTVTLGRAKKQAALLALLQEHRELGAEQLQPLMNSWHEPMRRLQEKGWVEQQERSCLQVNIDTTNDKNLLLNPEQQHAVEQLCARLGQFHSALLEGVTGSGKTEVYLQIIEQVLARGEQALVLVPEIGLTPQLLQRFRSRFSVPIAVLHSSLSDQERLCAWLKSGEGEAAIVIGTRSAVFTPLARPGLIIIDEEHDASFKQQEGFRYSARDLGIKRARDECIPILLGSATPSLESLHNALSGRFAHLPLKQRAGAAQAPTMSLLDIRSQSMETGLSAQLIEAVRQTLEKDEQVLLFLNRRGFSPILMCHDCGWVSACKRCDANLTFYRQHNRLRCNHCGSEQRVEPACPACGSVDLRDIGHGTEKIEESLVALFPHETIVRIDRDNTRRKGSLEALLAQAQSGEARILLGTQMLAKGHHFANVTLVGILDSDQGLFSSDFRAAERMAQLIIQVAGRAGRAEKPGRVLIQTHHPDHPLLLSLIRHGYQGYAEAALAERKLAEMPPYSHLALIRAEAVDASLPFDFLQEALSCCLALNLPEVQAWGPVPAPMERRAGRYRAQLLLQSSQRAPLHKLLQQLAPQLEGLKSARKVRWSLDVDPSEMF